MDCNMKKWLYPCILIGFFTALTILYSGCAHKERVRESSYSEGKLYQQSYDTVWDAVHGLIFTDLGYVEKKVNKKKGYIETEWATRLTGRGTSRWKIIAQVKQKKDGTLVLFNRDEEETAGKGLSDESIDNYNLYQQLEDKLK
jgi:hypothetical protein